MFTKESFHIRLICFGRVCLVADKAPDPACDAYV